MSSVAKVLKNRQSYRNMKPNIDEEKVFELLSLAQRTATSINGQQVSLVVITEREKILKMAEYNGQEHIKNAGAIVLFAIDYNRADEVMADELVINEHLEGLIVGSIDAGLLAQSVDLLMQDNQIATCILGGIRQNLVKVRELVNMTGKAVPVLAMSLGEEALINEDPRPRVALESFVFANEYREAKVRQGANEYNEDLKAWWAAKGITDHRSYAQSMNSFYVKNYMPNQLADLQQCNFLTKLKECE